MTEPDGREQDSTFANLAEVTEYVFMLRRDEEETRRLRHASTTCVDSSVSTSISVTSTADGAW